MGALRVYGMSKLENPLLADRASAVRVSVAMITMMVLVLISSSTFGAPQSLSAKADSGRVFDQAVKLFDLAEYQKALVLFNKLNLLDGGSAVYYYRGVCLYEVGDYSKSLIALAAVDSADSLYPLACFYRGKIMDALGDPAQAVKYLRVAVTRDSTYGPARLEFINVLLKLREFEEAKKFVAERSDAMEVIALCKGLIADRKYDAAYPLLAKLLAVDSTNAIVNLMLADAYFQTGKYSLAIERYSFILQTFGPSPFVIKRLALCYGGTKEKANLEIAITLMSRYLILSADTASEDIENIGLWYYDLGRYDSAENYFEKAVKLDTLDPQAWLNLGLALMQLGQPRGAIRAMRTAYPLSKSTVSFSLSILKGIAAAELRIKDYDEAIRTYRRVFEIDPGSEEALYGLALAYDQSQHPKEARYWYQRFIVNDSGHNPSLANYARRRLKELSTKR